MLFQTNLSYIVLQTNYLASGGFDSLSETEIIPFSGVSKSGAGCISHAGGAGGWARGGELQLASASVNSALQNIDLILGIIQFLGAVFVDCSHGALCAVLPVELTRQLAIGRLQFVSLLAQHLIAICEIRQQSEH
ncbi:Uncharacterised protein [Serratia marcescens]|nr:Uncharacterised protein [Serratia marcescens]CVH72531.1 Uncharacterised protein [Serratia marcescens]